jgi:hypothetical protein
LIAAPDAAIRPLRILRQLPLVAAGALHAHGSFSRGYDLNDAARMAHAEAGAGRTGRVVPDLDDVYDIDRAERVCASHGHTVDVNADSGWRRIRH